MGKRCAALIALAAVILCRPLASHNQMERDYADALSRAKAVAVAEVTAADKDDSRCETTFRYELKLLYGLRGAVEPGRSYPFSYSVFYWKRAAFPWQKDCESVHYTVPPVAPDMSRGAKVIVTLEYSEHLKSDAVASTADIKRLDEVKGLFRGK